MLYQIVVRAILALERLENPLAALGEAAVEQDLLAGTL
jgi:hypothetical protein